MANVYGYTKRINISKTQTELNTAFLLFNKNDLLNFCLGSEWNHIDFTIFITNTAIGSLAINGSVNINVGNVNNGDEISFKLDYGDHYLYLRDGNLYYKTYGSLGVVVQNIVFCYKNYWRG